MFILLWHTTLAIIAYDCSSPESKFTTVSLVSEPHCQYDIQQLSSTTVKAQVLQVQNYENVNVIQCLVTYDVTVTSCGGWFADNMFATFYQHIKHLTHDQKLHDTYWYRDPQFPYVAVYIDKNDYGE